MPVISSPGTQTGNRLASSMMQAGARNQSLAARFFEMNMAAKRQKKERLIQYAREFAAKREGKREAKSAEGDDTGSMVGGGIGLVLGAILAIPTAGASLAIPAAAATSSAMIAGGGVVGAGVGVGASALTTAGTMAAAAATGGGLGRTIGGMFDEGPTRTTGREVMQAGKLGLEMMETLKNLGELDEETERVKGSPSTVTQEPPVTSAGQMPTVATAKTVEEASRLISVHGLDFSELMKSDGWGDWGDSQWP